MFDYPKQKWASNKRDNCYGAVNEIRLIVTVKSEKARKW